MNLYSHAAMFYAADFFPQHLFFGANPPTELPCFEEKIPDGCRTVILPYGGFYPETLREPLLEHLNRGGDLVILGERPLGSPCRKVNGQWEICDPHNFGDRWRHSFASMARVEFGISFLEVPAANVLAADNLKVQVTVDFKECFSAKEFSCERYTGAAMPLPAGRSRAVASAENSTSCELRDFVNICEPVSVENINGRILIAGILPGSDWTADIHRDFLGGLLKVLEMDAAARLPFKLKLSSWVARADEKIECRCPVGQVALKIGGNEITAGSDPMILPSLAPGKHPVDFGGYFQGWISVLKNQDIPQVKVCRRHGYPAFEINGNIVPAHLYSFNPFDLALDRLSGQFGEAGIHLYNFLFPPVLGWLGEDCYDWAALDRMVERALHQDPEGMFFPRIFLQTPQWWDDANPGELKYYRNGQNYFDNSGRKPPDRTSKYSMLGLHDRTTTPCWHSVKWRHDVCRMLESLIDHINQSRYRGNFLGYFFANGIFGEWIEFGDSINGEDFSPASLAAFRQWLRQNYGDDQEKRDQIWNELTADPELVNLNGMASCPSLRDWRQMLTEVTPAEFEKAEPPNYVRRHQSEYGVFRNPGRQWDAIEYLRYIQFSRMECIRYFARFFKETTLHKQAIGTFTGYLMQEYLHDADGEAALYGFQRYLMNESSGLDIACSPFHYYRRLNQPECDGNVRTVTGSFKLHNMVFINENDQRTGLSDRQGDFTLISNGGAGIAESMEYLKRNFLISMVHGAGLWWYDFGGGWYDQPEMMALIGRFQQIYNELVTTSPPAPAELDALNVIYSTSAYDYINACSPLCRINTTVQVQEHLNRNGFPWEAYFLEDLPKVPQCRAWLFMNIYAVTAEQQRQIEQLKQDGNLLIWLYAPGLYAEGQPDLVNCRDLAGFKLNWSKEPSTMSWEVAGEHSIARKLRQNQFQGYFPPDADRLRDAFVPVFYVDDPEAEIVGTYRNSNRTAFAVRDFGNWKSAYIASPLVPAPAVRALMEWAGLTPLLTGQGDALYSNGDLIGINTRIDGEKIVKLPHEFSITEMITGEKYHSANHELKLHLKRGQIFFGRFGII